MKQSNNQQHETRTIDFRKGILLQVQNDVHVFMDLNY